MSAVAERPPAPGDELEPVLNVYEPHRVGLPPLRKYFRELWRRRQFAVELARSELRAQHFNTALGQLWLVLNPLFLGFVYFALVTIVRGDSRGAEFLAHLMLGLFAFHLVSGSIRPGAKSVVGGGRLILNTAFPRSLLPLASVLTAFMRFLPTLVIYALVHALAGLPVTPQILWAIPIFGLMVVFALGVTMLVAAVQVYFRDLRNFLPLLPADLGLRLPDPLLRLRGARPAASRSCTRTRSTRCSRSLTETVNLGHNPRPEYLAWSVLWAVGALVVGALFFISREREFAVRL